VDETAIYTRTDGLVDWRYFVTGNPERDFEVTGTHVGLAFNPAVYGIIAQRLAVSWAAQAAEARPAAGRRSVTPVVLPRESKSNSAVAGRAFRNAK